MIITERTVLRSWRNEDLDAFSAMTADPEVMADSGGPISRDASAQKMVRYREAESRLGYGRMVVTSREGEFLGYVGIAQVDAGHPCAGANEIGWRLVRKAWGFGLATEAARAALEDGFLRCGLEEVISFTEATNLRSQAVMRKLELERDPSRDFETSYDGFSWSGLVWVARPPSA